MHKLAIKYYGGARRELEVDDYTLTERNLVIYQNFVAKDSFGHEVTMRFQKEAIPLRYVESINETLQKEQ